MGAETDILPTCLLESKIHVCNKHIGHTWQEEYALWLIGSLLAVRVGCVSSDLSRLESFSAIASITCIPYPVIKI